MTQDTKNTTTIDLYKKIIVVYSPAGGNGKSEIAANLAYTLADAGKRVWIMDTNIYAPALDIILNIKSTPLSFLDVITPGNTKKKKLHLVKPIKASECPFSLYVTPAGYGDQDMRRDILEKIVIDDSKIQKIQKFILNELYENQIDLCIIDTHPGFELINKIWFAMTQSMLLISRLNDLDLRTLHILLKDIDIADIEKKLIVFNNVQMKDNQASYAMDNKEMLDKFKELIYQDGRKEELAGSPACNGNLCGSVEFYPNPFLYSKELSLYQQKGDRSLIFSKKKPDDEFSLRIRELASYICNNYLSS